MWREMKNGLGMEGNGIEGYTDRGREVVEKHIHYDSNFTCITYDRQM